MVFVFHPGIQHSHQLSWALNDIGALDMYISGIPVSNGGNRSLSEKFMLHNRFALIPINKKFHFILFSIFRKLIGIVLGFKIEQRINLFFDIFFDFLMAIYVSFRRPAIVIGYENSSYYTFKQVKKYGGRCVLDAASLHYSNIINNGSKNFVSKLVESRKSKEHSVADLILCCSKYARQTYLKSGIAEGKLQSIALGVKSTAISKHEFSDVFELKDELSIVYAGSISISKGVDVLIEAIKLSMSSDDCKIKLTLVGRVLEKSLLDEIECNDWIFHHNYVAQIELFEIMRANDISVLFSRGDSFGMVVPEAMSCGCPVIVSTCVGAKEIIEEFPDAGWILDFNVETLSECLSNIFINRKLLPVRKRAALKAASVYSWEKYRLNVQIIIGRYLHLWNLI